MYCGVYKIRIVLMYLVLDSCVLFVVFIDVYIFVYLCPVLSMCSAKLDLHMDG